jgi:hypothetical protein
LNDPRLASRRGHIVRRSDALDLWRRCRRLDPLAIWNLGRNLTDRLRCFRDYVAGHSWFDDNLADQLWFDGYFADRLGFVDGRTDAICDPAPDIALWNEARQGCCFTRDVAQVAREAGAARTAADVFFNGRPEPRVQSLIDVFV